MESTKDKRYIVENMTSSKKKTIAIPKLHEEFINNNKPWRVVIRRKIEDGRSDYENI